VTIVASDDLAEWDSAETRSGATIVDAAFTVDDERLVLTDFVLSASCSRSPAALRET
jgi:hypothetical protein